jgi:hypothetical protein
MNRAPTITPCTLSFCSPLGRLTALSIIEGEVKNLFFAPADTENGHRQAISIFIITLVHNTNANTCEHYYKITWNAIIHLLIKFFKYNLLYNRLRNINEKK